MRKNLNSWIFKVINLELITEWSHCIRNRLKDPKQGCQSLPNFFKGQLQNWFILKNIYSSSPVVELLGESEFYLPNWLWTLPKLLHYSTIVSVSDATTGACKRSGHKVHTTFPGSFQLAQKSVSCACALQFLNTVRFSYLGIHLLYYCLL